MINLLRPNTYLIILATLFFLSSFFGVAKLSGQSFELKALDDKVEIIVDEFGIPHIYAQNEKDLFFAQGFYAAKDRLFQFEVWRRQATGTVAELLGPRELKRDIGTRLFKFRGDMDDEMNHYHPRGKLIIESYVEGINAYISIVQKDPSLLPYEFKLLGTQPEKWTPADVISRHQGLLGNINQELAVGRQVALLGSEKVKEINWFHPHEPNLEIDAKINSKHLLENDILEIYNAYRTTVKFQPEDLIASVRNDQSNYEYLVHQQNTTIDRDDIKDIGSNNWVVTGAHTSSGYPMMANDPHRRQSAPSLRYMAHLVAPGWNVIGGGEPEIPGISIGHNEYGAWGLTVYRTDAEDLYVYETNPDNPLEYKYKGDWEKMTVIEEVIKVKGEKDRRVQLKYTRHGPVVFEDISEDIAYAVRCGWLEIGGSPYLASLRMNQSKNFEEFRDACNYSNIPGENMIWADKEGNIGWQSVGIAPVRRNWSGLVPVPGDGSYEWDGYLPIIDKPNVYNPESGIFITANENVTPQDYPHMDAVGYSWADPFRGDRVAEVLHAGTKQTLSSMAALQTDYHSIPARTLVPMLRGLEALDGTAEEARQLLLDWDEYNLVPESVEAGIYVAWERALKDKMDDLMVLDNVKSMHSLQLSTIINWIVMPDKRFGENILESRDEFLRASFNDAVQNLTNKLGNKISNWEYGQVDYKHIILRHPMSNAVSENVRKKLDVGPLPRGGNSYTVGSTGGNNNQSSGGSFRIIVDTGNWDHCIGTNTPGQSGDPDNPMYRNLFDSWAKDKYFPVYYSKDKIESVESHRLILNPK